MENRKTKVVTVKFTPSDYELICRKANQSHSRLSTYIRDAAIAGAQRRENKAAERIEVITQFQETVNKFYLFLEKETAGYSEDLKDLVDQLNKEVDALWALS